MAARDDVPRFDELMLPTLAALKALGGSASNEELHDWVADHLKLSAETRDRLHGEGPNTSLRYRLHWARSYLKAAGAIDNSERGVWTLLDAGERVTASDVDRIKRDVRAQQSRRRKRQAEPDTPASPDQPDEEWDDRLVAVLQAMTPDGFERLCQRVLRESGFISVDVTGRSGDGGIDGMGVLRMNLVSFHVLFQCKRWKGSVGSSVIRDFRGAMVGRADKGLVITTGTFTSEAAKEARRDGAPAIDLIDGEALCGLLKRLKLGVEVKLVEQVEIDEAFFRSI